MGAALVGGYEVAARTGAATHLHDGVHPHGNWGALGAAAGVCRLADDSPRVVTTALAAAAGLVLATPFATVLGGNRVRDAWVAHANTAGLHARNLAAAGLATPNDTIRHSLGGLLGELDTTALAENLGQRWTITEGYFKQHASCSYTHPPADATLTLRACHQLDFTAIRSIRVATHRLAVGLAAHRCDTRLAAMFSIPYVVAVALLHGDCAPLRFDARHRSDPEVSRIARMVTVEHDRAMDDDLPGQRHARVEVTLADGRHLTSEVPNPVGDTDHHPFDRPRIETKAHDLLDPAGVNTDQVITVVDDLLDATDVRTVLDRLP